MTHHDSTAPADIHFSTLELVKELIERRSIVPEEAGCLELIANRLAKSGFSYERMDRGKPHNLVRNLWARHGFEQPIVCFAGHIDVPPPESAERWTSDPFVPTERDGWLYGRGAADMKTAVAAMITAAERFVARAPDHRGSIAIALTSDKEGAVNDGTLAIVQQMLWRGEKIDACILGEPTALAKAGDAMKNGRRGSLHGALTVKRVQGHVACLEDGRNPVHLALPALAELATTEWDSGNQYFTPTTFQISNVHAGAGAANVIPETLEVRFGFRFGTASSADALRTRVHDLLVRHGVEPDLSWVLVRAPYCTPQGRLTDVMTATASAIAGVTPALSTTGGTSDGSLFATVAGEVIECGLVSMPPEAVDERVRLADIAPLSQIYEQAITALLS
jgi:succinyl-diaminopimelate desuccinylase